MAPSSSGWYAFPAALGSLCSGIKVTRGPGTVALEQEPLLCAYKAVEAVLLPRQLLFDVAAQHDPQFWPLGSQRGAIVVDHVAAEIFEGTAVQLTDGHLACLAGLPPCKRPGCTACQLTAFVGRSVAQTSPKGFESEPCHPNR